MIEQHVVDVEAAYSRAAAGVRGVKKVKKSEVNFLGVYSTKRVLYNRSSAARITVGEESE